MEYDEEILTSLRTLRGSGVHSIAHSIETSYCGVYELYCIMQRGIYKGHGTILNRQAYNAPIYIGTWGCNQHLDPNLCFSSLNLEKQIETWEKLISESRATSKNKFLYRALSFKQSYTANLVYQFDVSISTPLWNQYLPSSLSADIFCTAWRDLHLNNTEMRNSMLSKLGAISA